MVKKVRNPDLSAWVKLYTRDLYSWALNKTSDPQLSEDLVQDTFLAAVEKIASFKGKSHPRTWLFGILKNNIADHYRKILRKGSPSLFSPHDLTRFFNADGTWQKTVAMGSWEVEAEHLTDQPEFNKVLDECIDHLPTMMHACIRLKFLDDKKGEQICQDLGISATNYWQLIRRAKLQLRDCLELNWFKLKS